MTDDDDTPPRGRQRPGSHWDSDRRALESQQRRARSNPRGVPIVAPMPEPRSWEDLTPVTDLLERDLSQTEIEVVQRSSRDGTDVATWADIVKLAEALTKERSENRTRDQQYEAVLRSPHEIATQLSQRVDATEAQLRTARRIVIAAVTVLATCIGTIASGVLNRTEEHGGDRVRLEQFRRDIDRLEEELRDIRITLGRRSALDAPSSPTAIIATTSKGSEP